MIKKHLTELIDVKLIIFLVVILVVVVILTMIFGEKAKDFKEKFKRKYYIYVFSLIFAYALVSFLGNNKLFIRLSDEFLFYQIVSLIFGILHVYMYRWYLEKFNLQSFRYELLFTLIVVLCSNIPFIIIHTALSGIAMTFWMCSHFLIFFLPTLVNGLFNNLMAIPAKIYQTWQIPEDENSLPVLQDSEMRDIVVVTLLILKNEGDTEYSSFRAKGPIRMDFGRLFYYAITNYNDRYPKLPVQLAIDDEPCNWVFFLKPSKWYQTSKYVDAKYTLYMNGITENSVIICQRRKEDAETLLKDENKDYVYEPES